MCVLHLHWFSRWHTKIPAIFNAITGQFDVHISKRDNKSEGMLFGRSFGVVRHTNSSITYSTDF